MTKIMASRRKDPQDQIFKLRVALAGSDALIWRRVLVPDFFTLEALHSVLQLAMGWQMKHLYDFHIGGKQYAEPDDFDGSPVGSVAASLASAVREHKTFIYNYDFGDDWRHEITVEEIVSRDSRFSYPACIGGENACPPEDCHGVSGYADLKAVLSNPKHPEYDETLQWLGGYFDPTTFDPNRINHDMLWMIDWKREPNDQGLYLPFNFEDTEGEEEPNRRLQ